MLIRILTTLLSFAFVSSCQHGRSNGECFEYHRNWQLLPHGKCGDKFSNDVTTRIVGGKPTPYGRFAWLVNLYSNETDLHLFRGCVGNAITQKYVLTGIQCVVRVTTDKPKLWVRSGEFHVGTKTPQFLPSSQVQHVQNIQVESIAMMEEGRQLESVFALLRLSIPFSFDRYIRPICLPTHRALLEMNLDGMTLDSAGWSVENDQDYGGLWKVILPVENCDKRYPGNVYSPYLICAGGKLNGTLRSASFYEDGTSIVKKMSLEYGGLERYYIFGVFSNHLGKRFKAIYTKVSPHIEWILNNLNP